MHTHTEDEEAKKEAWDAEQEKVDEILEKGIQATVEGTGAVEAAMAHKPTALTCIDERATPAVAAEGEPAAVCCAGCGILIPGAREFLENGTVTPELQEYIDRCKAQGITDIYPHLGCGAAEKFADSVGAKGKGGEYAVRWAQKLGGAIGATTHEPVPVEPESFHDARAVYWDATEDGRFNPNAHSAFPKGFHVSESVMGGGQARNEVAAAAGIAFDHGFGDRFTPENPLIIVVVAHSPEEASERASEAQAIADQSGGSIVVQTLIVPKP